MEITLAFVNSTTPLYLTSISKPFVQLTKVKLKEIYKEIFLTGLKLVDLRSCTEVQCFFNDSDDTDLITITKDLSEVDLEHCWSIVTEAAQFKEESFKQIETFVEDISKELDLK